MGTRSFCLFCGGPHQNEDWPRICSLCGKEYYDNPLPVALVLQPIAGQGLLGVRRNIEPARGRLALPGGYVNRNESWVVGAARELLEETGVERVATDLTLFEVCDTPVNVIILAARALQPLMSMPLLKPNHEVIELSLITPANAHELAWDTHRTLAEKYFAQFPLTT